MIDSQAMKTWCFHIIIAIVACFTHVPLRTRRPYTGITAHNYELFYRMVIRVSTIFDYKVVVTLTIVLVVRTCNALAIGDKIG